MQKSQVDKSQVETQPTLHEQLRELPGALGAQDEFAAALEHLQTGGTVTFDGVWGSSLSLLGAELARHAEGLLIVTPRLAQIDDVVADLELFGERDVCRFPACETTPDRQLLDEQYGDRVRTLKRLTQGPQPRVIVASIQSLMQPVPDIEDLRTATLQLEVGERIDLDHLRRWLAEARFHASSAVELPGEFAARGGILDIYPVDSDRPLRIEFFDDEIESVRSFDPATQRSVESLNRVEITAVNQQRPAGGSLLDYLPASWWSVVVDPEELAREGQNFRSRSSGETLPEPGTLLGELQGRGSFATTGWLTAGSLGQLCRLPVESVQRFSGEIGRVQAELDRAAEGQQIYVFAETASEAERLQELLAETEAFRQQRLAFPLGDLTGGFRLTHTNTVLVTGRELFQRSRHVRRVSRRTTAGRHVQGFGELKTGDLVVHLAHGIGRYRGMARLTKNGQEEDYLAIEFHGGTKIYVPATKIGMVQKYVGGSKSRPSLAKVGGKAWAKQRRAAEAAVHDMAAEMLELQAFREARPGIAFAGDSSWQREFDCSFPYRETPDQLTSIQAIKHDMEQPRPMDRLLCGDVGFGKTEVAMRAVFKAVDSGYQVAVMAPTTILAEQHYRNFCDRMAAFPFDIGKLSRFCSAREQRETLAGLATGRIDVVIGTHRVASRDVEFYNLGLVIIDEEQRFGVGVKERLKALRSSVDVLTMSATPIPRTLHMSLVGVRDISNLETPPDDRHAVETHVTRFRPELIREAVLRELNRGGQVYFVHNRVEDIESVARKLQEIVPEASLKIAHGQMHEAELEEVVLQFVGQQFDLLLATTIVESGLDIPTANTIFINDADRFGLADLHQLRGRVGRYKHHAYCYLLVDPRKSLSPTATRRLRAIEEFSEMGAGFSISMRDLEIRGAGNLLGTAQSGHIAAVGYEYYCQLLESAVREVKQLPPRLSHEVDIELPGTALIPSDYVDDMRVKIDLYRRTARLETFEQLEELRAELHDRFGKPPGPVERMLQLASLRLTAASWQIVAIRLDDRFLVLEYSVRARIEQLAKTHAGKLRVVDEKHAYYPLPPASGEDPEEVVLRLAESILQSP